MTLLDRSASAYETLANLSSAYVEDQRILQLWRVFSRAVLTLQAAYALESPNDQVVQDMLHQSSQSAFSERKCLHVEMADLQDKIDRLNAQIQNGVYDNEQE